MGKSALLLQIGAVFLALSGIPGLAIAGDTNKHMNAQSVTVDAGAVEGRLKPLSGVNGPPRSMRSGMFVDVSAEYRDARIDFIRVHDAGAGDIDAVYSVRGRMPGRPIPEVVAPRTYLNPNSIFLNSNADPDNPDSYNFGPTDTLLRELHAIGAQPLFRLGRSESADADVPRDFDKYAKIAAHIVAHYNLGWDSGFRYGIKYWEIWNEPDFTSFWDGQPEQYYDFYAKVAVAVKAADPTILVGGPAQASPLDVRPFGEDFLAYVRDHKLPLDFYSWHWYTQNNDPYDLARLGSILRERLDRYGFAKTSNIVDEWGSSHSSILPLGGDEHASFMASALIYLQQSPVDAQFYYRADGFFGTPRPKEGNVLKAWGAMKDTPIRIRTSGTRSDGFAVEAGKSEDGKLIQVFISNYQAPERDRVPSPPGPVIRHVLNEGNFSALRHQEFKAVARNGYSLTLANLPAGKLLVKRFRISGDSNLDLVDSQVVNGPRAALKSDLKASGVEFLQISAVQ